MNSKDERVKFIIEEYADCSHEQDIYKVIAEIKEIYLDTRRYDPAWQHIMNQPGVIEVALEGRNK
uniref:Uncharacterized protein n=1 Tax=viral metagenome TaxID=1070528 RepID=A0A6M3XYT4_9ZZZZ